MAAAPEPGLVDLHTHAIAPSLPDLEDAVPWGRWPSVERLTQDSARILVGGRPYREIDDRCWSPARRVADLDAGGVAVQVISPVPVTFCHDAPAAGADLLARTQNDFLADVVARQPDRLRALAAVPLQAPDLAAGELRRCVGELGFIGAEIGTRVGDLELGDPFFDPFFDAVADLGAVVLVHPADTTLAPRLAVLGVTFGAGMPTETGIAAAGLLTSGAMLRRRPGIRLCLAHGGGTLPWLLPRLDRGELIKDPGLPPDTLPGALARQLYSDSLTYDEESLMLAVQRYGTGHVVLGTDYPFAAAETPPGAVLHALHDQALRDAIGSGNARELMRQDVPARLP
ncbi:MAG TPA: amidohydrolase family protein [Trebonia sp.]|jgi:aminocarboxymuconate-semialdehyde decarboxylase